VNYLTLKLIMSLISLFKLFKANQNYELHLDK